MIVGLTSASRINPYAALLMDELTRAGVPPAFVLTSARNWMGDLRERLDRRGWAAALRSLRRRRGVDTTTPSPLAEAARDRGLDLYAPLHRICRHTGVDVAPVADLASPAAAAAVRTRRAQVLINAGGGLFRGPLLSAPTHGILNAHMARLPDLRGVDVLEWSLLLGVQPGVSVHWVDSGVDTGQVLAFEALLPAASDTLESMRERAVVASARLLADRIQHLEPGTAPVTASSQPQFFALHPRLRAVAQARLTHCTVES